MVGPYELVERVDGPLWRVRGPDGAPYSLVTGDHGLGARLRHLRIPGMATLVDRGPGYLVYEDLPGTDVATEVRDRGPMKGERLVELLRVTARIMADLHRVGASHGGLGPRSVFLAGDRFVVAGPGAAGGADLVAWADLARFAATGEGSVPLADPLADLVIDCSCLPVDRRLSAAEVCRRVELLTAPRRGAGWAELGRLVGTRRWPNTRRVPRPLVRAYDELYGTAPMLELLYQFAAHDEREGTGWSRRRRGDRIEWAPLVAARGGPGEQVTVAVELRNRAAGTGTTGSCGAPDPVTGRTSSTPRSWCRCRTSARGTGCSFPSTSCCRGGPACTASASHWSTRTATAGVLVPRAASSCARMWARAESAMSYHWAIDPRDLFAERYRQMVGGGLPADDVDELSEAVGDMWSDAPGGWVYEWSRLAAEYAEQRRHHLAAQAYGWARFPTLADGARRAALARQVEQYQLAAPEFGVGFERRVLTVPHRDGTTAVPVHLLTPPGWSGDTPVLLAGGGVDTWRMDLHTIFETFALCTRMCVLAFDVPGTGESTVPMADGASVVCGLVAEARGIGDGRVAHLGISMGGHFSARTGLAGEVDAAIVLGGPVERSFAPGRRFATGMRDIVGNALGFDRPPTDAELAPIWPAFDLRPLLDRADNAPMLVINGADDVYVPRHDTLVFEGRRDTEVHLVPGAGHCAVSKLPEVIRVMFEWLARVW